jgi:hypothetical protein
MNAFDGCQIPDVPRLSEGLADFTPQSLKTRVKRSLAMPWNSLVKPTLKKAYYMFHPKATRRAKQQRSSDPAAITRPIIHLKAGDVVRVRSREEIQATLDPWKELRGCAFLEYMWEYCGTTQRVFKAMERFLDERDYKVKKVNGIVILEGVICPGTPVFGRCDRSCFLFWREEWLEKIEPVAEAAG